MIRYPAFVAIAALALTGCPPAEPDSTGDPDPCTNEVVATFPATGSTNAYYRTTIEATFDEAEDGATMTVTSSAGAVAGSTAWVGDNLVFTPNDPLAASTEYTAAITFSCGAPTFSFTTGEVGAPVTDPAGLAGKTYSLDLGSGRFVQPPGVGPLLKEYVTTEVLVGVDAVNGNQIEMIGAIAVDGSSPPAQSPCDPTIPFPTADFSENPYFEVASDKTTITVQGISVEIQDLVISGAFAPDASYISGAVLAGTIDTRPLVPLLDPEGEPGAICELAVTIGVNCSACSDGEMLCLELYVDSMTALEVPGLTLEKLEDPCTEKPDECAAECPTE